MGRSHLLPACAGRRCLTVATVGQATAATAEACDLSRLGPGKLLALAKLSAAGLCASPTGRKAGSVAARCVAAGSGRVAVALQLAAPAVAKLRAARRKARYAPRRPGSRAELAAAVRPASAWFAACLPVGCLGHDRRLQLAAWRVLWRRLAPLRPRSALPPLGADATVLLLRLFGDNPAPGVTEVLLAPEELEGAGEDGPFDIVAVTDAPERASALVESVPWPLRVRLLRPPAHVPWKFRFFDVERHLLAYTAHLRRRGHGERLVLYADAFDTVWLGCRRNMSRALEALARPMFFGAEFDLYPAGLPGFPLHAAEYPRATGLPLCRQTRALSLLWERRPVEEHEPCLAISRRPPLRASGLDSADEASAKFLNGGVYGGRAAALEGALRRILGVQAGLRERDAAGEEYRHHGKTHQYLWSQYFLERPEEVALDYGGAFVVNLARRSLSARQFGLDVASGAMRSVVFQRPVCLAHANGGGYADSTFLLLHAARTLRFDTTASAGFRAEALDAVAEAGLFTDLNREDRVVVDTSLCFGRLRAVRAWRGVLSTLDLVTPHNNAHFYGLQFMVLRPRARKEPGPAAFEVIDVQHMPIVTRRAAAGRVRRRNDTAHFLGRNRFDILLFRLKAAQGDCLGWRCLHRCDLTYRELAAGHSQASGAWHGPGRDLVPGEVLVLEAWKPHAYAIGATAEVTGVSFYEPEDGG